MAMPSDTSEFSAVAELIGDDAARVLAQRLGGTYLYVPKTPGPDHPIALLLGQTTAQRLAEHFCGDTILVPRGRRTGNRARVIELRQSTQMTITQIALATGYHVRQVLRILAEEDHKRQLDLF